MRFFGECKACGNRLGMKLVPVAEMQDQWVRIMIDPCQTCKVEYVQKVELGYKKKTAQFMAEQNKGPF